MSSATRKHTDFVTEPMKNKPVGKLPGIGEKAASKLIAQGFPRANMVLGQFLILGQNKEPFIVWLQSVSHCSDSHAAACWQALQEWCVNYI